jgi:hypothetical protein
MAPDEDVHDKVAHRATVNLLRWIGVLTQDFRRGPTPMPVLVLHAREPEHEGGGPGPADEAARDRAAAGVVDELFAEYVHHRARCYRAGEDPRPGETGAAAAMRLLRDLEDQEWENTRSGQYRPYAFPRSAFLTAVERAAARVRVPPDDSAFGRALLAELDRGRWRKDDQNPLLRFRTATSDVSRFLPAVLLAVLAGVMALGDAWVTAASAAVVLTSVLLLETLPRRAPLLLGSRPEVRWFCRTTFLNFGAGPSGTDRTRRRRPRSPLPPRGTLAARTEEVARQMLHGGLLEPGTGPVPAGDGLPSARTPRGREPGARQRLGARRFHLQLRVLALLEDLRDDHRAWAADLRRRKRTVPPVLFLPRVTEDNGGLALVEALSDVRSRRSELDPLLVVAAVRRADLPALGSGGTGESHPDADDGVLPIGGDEEDGGERRPDAGLPALEPLAELRRAYRAWNRDLRAGQSPSRGDRTLPWVLGTPLPPDWLTPANAHAGRVCEARDARRTVAGHLWSLPLLAVVLVAGALGGWRYDHQLRQRHCHVEIGQANRDTERVPGRAGGAPECVGVATGDVTFPGSAELLALQEAIRSANARIPADAPRVTIVYAGPLTGPRDQLVKGVEELTGLHIAQYGNNVMLDKPVKLRVLLANGGSDMYAQTVMARHVADVARRDPSVVGVVGLGRNTADSPDVQRILRAVDLPVISTTNSATDLPRRYANFFGLAAPDAWQAEQFGLIAGQLRADPGGRRAAVIARGTASSGDRYTAEQARYGRAMLRKAGFEVGRVLRFPVRGGAAELSRAVHTVCGAGDELRVVYFAGRLEDLTTLMEELRTDSGCFGRRMAVMTGDDLSRADFEDKRGTVAHHVTLYHAALTGHGTPSAGSVYGERAQHAAVRGALPVAIDTEAPYDPRDYRSGHVALAHDATEVLYRAATRDGEPRSRALTWVNLRSVTAGGLATGVVDFSGAGPYEPRDDYGFSLLKVTNPGAGPYRNVVLCSREAGSARPLTREECAIDAEE